MLGLGFISLIEEFREGKGKKNEHEQTWFAAFGTLTFSDSLSKNKKKVLEAQVRTNILRLGLQTPFFMFRLERRDENRNERRIQNELFVTISRNLKL